MPISTIFLHLQKTGGTSIRHVMRIVFGNSNCAESNNRRNDGRWVTLSGRQIRASAWMGHMSFGLHTMLPTPVPYFTVVRDPVQREVSRFRCMPQLREKGLTPYTAVYPEWGMVYQLSGIPLDDIGTLGEEHVDLALKNLHGHFAFIGDTARFDDIGIWFKRDLRWPIELPLPRLNVSGPDVTVTGEEVEALRHHPQVQLDQKLYDRICELGPLPPLWRL